MVKTLQVLTDKYNLEIVATISQFACLFIINCECVDVCQIHMLADTCGEFTKVHSVICLVSDNHCFVKFRVDQVFEEVLLSKSFSCHLAYQLSLIVKAKGSSPSLTYIYRPSIYRLPRFFLQLEMNNNDRLNYQV